MVGGWSREKTTSEARCLSGVKKREGKSEGWSPYEDPGEARSFDHPNHV
jgi:hypothetical protein